MIPDGVPGARWSLPRRSRLDRALDAAHATGLALVVAPPGWGARGAIAGWAASRRLDTAELVLFQPAAGAAPLPDSRIVAAKLQPRRLVIVRAWREPGIRLAPVGVPVQRIGVDDLRLGPTEAERCLSIGGWHPDRGAIDASLLLTGGRSLWLQVIARALGGLDSSARDEVLRDGDLEALGLDAVARELLDRCTDGERSAARAAGHGAVSSAAVAGLEARGLLDPDPDHGRRLDPVIAQVLSGPAPAPVPSEADGLTDRAHAPTAVLVSLLSDRPSSAVRAVREAGGDDAVARVARILLRPVRTRWERDAIARDLEAEARRAHRRGLPETARLVGLIAEAAEGHGHRAVGVVSAAGDRDGALVLARCIDLLNRRARQASVPAPASAPAAVDLGPSTQVGPSARVAERHPVIEVECFGGFRLRADGRDLALTQLRPRARTLLKILVLNASAPVHRDTLAAVLWPDASERSALHNLHVGLSAARAVIGSAGPGVAERVLVRRDAAYAFDTGMPSRADFARFDAELRAADLARSHHDAADAAAHLRAALELYAGDLLPEDGDAEWVVGARERYRHRAAEAASSLARYALHAGELHEAADAAIRSVDLERWRDESWRTLLAVYRASGDAVSLNRAQRSYGAILRELQES